jgi:hypothetical protein
MSQDFLQSTYREKLIEQLFVGELLKYSWLHRACALEIAKPEVDNCGYDVIATEARIIRHLQLKTSSHAAKAAHQKVQIALGMKPSGCVVWIHFDPDTLVLGPFLFFGGVAGEPMPTLSTFKVARHTKANTQGIMSERPNLRVIPKARFTRFEHLEEVYAALFGPVEGA